MASQVLQDSHYLLGSHNEIESVCRREGVLSLDTDPIHDGATPLPGCIPKDPIPHASTLRVLMQYLICNRRIREIQPGHLLADHIAAKEAGAIRSL